jgi:NAD(P)-dependent dehydrogenase (short-subunit alcohol dehydrogenase family)
MAKFIIAGGSSGIGYALTKKLIGHEIIVLSRSRRSVAANSEHYTVDFSLDEITLPALEGPLDGLVYCPGSIKLKPFGLFKDHDFLDDWKLNFLGAVKCIRHYLPNLKLSQNPSILLFSTVAVQTGMPFHASIASTKGAVEGLTRSLAAEFAPKIRVNAIAPSLTDTPLAASLINTEQKLNAAKDRHPLKRIGRDEEVAALVAFLLSAEAGFISGQVYGIDGGMSSLRMM